MIYYEKTEGNLEVKLPTIWTDGKTEVGRVREEKRRKKTREEKESEERRCRCAKKRWRKCVPVWREAHFEVKCVNN